MNTKMATAPVALTQPQENEHIHRDEYTIRIEISKEFRSDVEKVELFIDRGAPIPCMGALGYYWHDWSDYRAGEHHVVALVKTRHGKILSAGPRHFTVDMGRSAFVFA